MMQTNNKSLVAFDKVIEDIEKAKEQGNFLPDVSTKEGYTASKRFVLDVTTKMRKAIEAAHKEAKAPILEQSKLIDGKKKELISMVKEIEEPHQLAYKEHDRIEKERKAKFEADIESKIQDLIAPRSMIVSKTSEQISTMIDEVGEVDTSHGFYTRQKDAELARQGTLDILNAALIQAVQFESMQEQLKSSEQKKEAEQQNTKTPEFRSGNVDPWDESELSVKFHEDDARDITNAILDGLRDYGFVCEVINGNIHADKLRKVNA